MNYITLNNGVKMPQLGYGVYQVTKDECERCVADALKVGYRLIDTAQSYFNEEEVGAAIAKSGIPREEIFLTTKVWIEHYGYEACRASVLESKQAGLPDIRFHDLRHPYVKHTTKKYNSEKQKTQATKMNLIAWVFRFCTFNYSKRSWTL